MSEKLFTQEEVNQIIKERVAREKRSFEREIEEVRSGAHLDTPDYKAMYLDAFKRTSIQGAGFPMDKIDSYLKYIKGDSEDEIKREIAELAQAAGVNSAGNGQGKSSKSGTWNPF
ncbi:MULTISPECIES: hypothetical protein [unclassified Cytobacillus]|uniref:hypothetical protein n=1 Tax=unclassified Cytobacillus TaxID=2675268 RepID=UPI00203A6C3B|nr:hypothetical protein [Cytobacillus sp. AMY 15.2]MCM3093825.1 hypothetical protein [Cytobacillus sp. AMY 15.2]